MQELLDVANVLLQSFRCNLVDQLGEARKEIAVVRYDDERAVKIFQCALQNFFCLDIEVVCGFVEDEQIVGVEEELTQGESGFLTAGKYLDFFVDVFSREEEGSEDGTKPFADFSNRNFIEGFGYGQVAVELFGLVLGVVTDIYVVADGQFTAAVLQPHEDAREGSLAGSVFSYQGNLLLSWENEVQFLEHMEITEGLAQFLGFDAHLAGARSRGEAKPHFCLVGLVHFNPFQFIQFFNQGLSESGLILLSPKLID